VAEYRKTARGSQGVISISTSDRNGQVVAAGLVEETDNIMLMTDQGVLIRTRVSEVRETGRSAQGVKLINLKSNEKLVSVQVVAEAEIDDDLDEETPLEHAIESSATDDVEPEQNIDDENDLE
jgi:DNA gyrase subunit A